jgi:phenylalanyl-tRNA synthetase alpha chain
VPNHPIKIVKDLIYRALPYFRTHDHLSPRVPVEENFDLLRIPPDHPSRRPSDTYYFDERFCLRTHTSAHQVQLLRDGVWQFLVTGDVYRKDAIDATHYPVFHQMEGVKVTPAGVDPLEDLRKTVDGLLEALFPGAKSYWNTDYFPFTEPSFEVEVEIQAPRTELLGGGKMKVEVQDGTIETKRMEVLGCGVIHPEIFKNAGLEGRQGWAFGLGLERLAMKLFKIPDIRLFWSKDLRFGSQFQEGKISEFIPFSKHPTCYKDITFWVPDQYSPNDFTEVVRDLAGDLVETVQEMDTYERAGRTSKCYRVVYRSMERTLSNEEVDKLQEGIRQEVVRRLKVELR